METKRVTRRKHSKEFRAEGTQACREPRASVAAIALRSWLNANVVYRWLREEAGVDVDAGSLTVMGGRPGAEFLAVQLPPPAAAQSTAIRLEMRRGASSVTVSWPLQGRCRAAAGRWPICCLAARVAEMIRIDAVWLATSAFSSDCKGSARWNTG